MLRLPLPDQPLDVLSHHHAQHSPAVQRPLVFLPPRCRGNRTPSARPGPPAHPPLLRASARPGDPPTAHPNPRIRAPSASASRGPVHLGLWAGLIIRRGSPLATPPAAAQRTAPNHRRACHPAAAPRVAPAPPRPPKRRASRCPRMLVRPPAASGHIAPTAVPVGSHVTSTADRPQPHMRPPPGPGPFARWRWGRDRAPPRPALGALPAPAPAGAPAPGPPSPTGAASRRTRLACAWYPAMPCACPPAAQWGHAAPSSPVAPSSKQPAILWRRAAALDGGAPSRRGSARPER
jgi:hypothetical protein